MFIHATDTRKHPDKRCPDQVLPSPTATYHKGDTPRSSLPFSSGVGFLIEATQWTHGSPWKPSRSQYCCAKQPALIQLITMVILPSETIFPARPTLSCLSLLISIFLSISLYEPTSPFSLLRMSLPHPTLPRDINF